MSYDLTKMEDLIQLKKDTPGITIEIGENGGVIVTGKGYPTEKMFKELIDKKHLKPSGKTQKQLRAEMVLTYVQEFVDEEIGLAYPFSPEAEIITGFNHFKRWLNEKV